MEDACGVTLSAYEEPEPVRVVNQPREFWLFGQFIALVIIVGALLYLCERFTPAATAGPDAAQRNTQAELQTEQLKLNIEQERAGLALRMKVFENCVERKMIPALVGGNVTCSAAK